MLGENSVLYALLCDTLTSLIKAETECKDPTKLGKKMQPKGMRFHPVDLKCYFDQNLMSTYQKWLYLFRSLK